jgi:phosphomevalonate kinase
MRREDGSDDIRIGKLEDLNPKRWDQGNESFRLPKGVRLMLADVDAGTDTPSFVGKVLAWRKKEPEEALQLWTDLSHANDLLRSALSELVNLESRSDYSALLETAAREPLEQVDMSDTIGQTLMAAREALMLIRSLMRKMSTASDVPIEPLEQTNLLDACSSQPGVLGGGVPGGQSFLSFPSRTTVPVGRNVLICFSWRIRRRLPSGFGVSG